MNSEQKILKLETALGAYSRNNRELERTLRTQSIEILNMRKSLQAQLEANKKVKSAIGNLHLVDKDVPECNFFDAVVQELCDAVSKFDPMRSHHEAYAIILEEMDGLWAEVKKWPKTHDLVKMRNECIHIAAMCARYHHDVISKVKTLNPLKEA
jgi:hypothetical protein